MIDNTVCRSKQLVQVARGSMNVISSQATAKYTTHKQYSLTSRSCCFAAICLQIKCRMISKWVVAFLVMQLYILRP